MLAEVTQIWLFSELAVGVPSGLRCKSASVASGFMTMLRGEWWQSVGTGEKP
jgi:hypothetical protein